ncbi:MAG: cob(I)yrinic acid a,c-diamide adenosyltransferase [Armatimonadetes bacterium]|nr:cob(I)yrinic acid a,c-diamide adenosyltransferase [Armatimonadota bacterium]
MSKSCRVIIFTGDGKGKTTAALGMALRASGHGMRVKIIQFIKGDSSTGELAALCNLPGVDMVQTGLGFVPPNTSPKFEDHRRAVEDGLKLAENAIDSGEYALIILDEMCGAVALGLLDEKKALDIIASAKCDSCIVMTGRGATQAMIDLADTVTEMKAIKHGMDDCIPAQKGVEF